MTQIEELIADLASRTGIGQASGPVLREVTSLISGTSGGLSGFLDRFRQAGLGAAVASWLGRSDGPALPADQIEQVLGASTVSGIAGRVGLPRETAGSALGYVIPKLVGFLTPGGTVPAGIPAALSAAGLLGAGLLGVTGGAAAGIGGLASGAAHSVAGIVHGTSTTAGHGTSGVLHAAASHGAVTWEDQGAETRESKGGIGGWGISLLAGLAGIGVIAWLMQPPAPPPSTITVTKVVPPVAVPLASAPLASAPLVSAPLASAPVPPVAVAPAPVVVAPAPVPTPPVASTPQPQPPPVRVEGPPPPAPIMPAPTLPAQFILTNDNGVVTVGGAVHDEATRTSIMNYLRSIFGADTVKGDIAVDPARKPGSWFGRLRDALEAMKIPGLKAMFDGDKITLNGLPNAAERDRLLTVLKGLFGSGMSLTGDIADRFSDLISGSQTKTLSALGSLRPGFSPRDLLNILNMAIINFATGSFEIPDSAETILKQAAVRLKELPAGTKVEIAGYTDNTGDSNMNVELSNQRASAVRDYLIKAGIDAGMLSAKGYGAASPVAANDTAEGRFQNRRIEYHLAP